MTARGVPSEETPQQMALADLGVALRRGDIPLAQRIQRWLAGAHRDGLSRGELRAAYGWPDERAALYHSERGRLGGLAVLEKHGREHFARITKGRKRRPRYTSPKETAGQPTEAVVAHIQHDAGRKGGGTA